MRCTSSDPTRRRLPPPLQVLQARLALGTHPGRHILLHGAGGAGRGTRGGGITECQYGVGGAHGCAMRLGLRQRQQQQQLEPQQGCWLLLPQQGKQ